jgi:hypothetical protein
VDRGGALKHYPGLKRESSASFNEFIDHANKVHYVFQDTHLRSARFDAPEQKQLITHLAHSARSRVVRTPLKGQLAEL